MDHWIGARVAEIRERITAADEASLWTLFFADCSGEPTIASAVDGAMDEMDLDLLRRIAEIASQVGAEGCLFAVIREDGRPRSQDAQAWRDLEVLMRGAGTSLLGFVVVGRTSYWVAGPEGDFGSAA